MSRVRGSHLSEALGCCLVGLCLKPALGPGVNPPPLTIAENMKPFLILKRTDFSSCGAGRNCYHVFSFLSNFPI